MKLNDVNKGIRKYKKRKRVGRGIGSGHGKTAGRGHKGQGSLAGWTSPPTFEGGHSPLIRRIPKRGFHNKSEILVHTVNVGDLNELFKDGEEITPEKLGQMAIGKGRYEMLKILGDGELKKKLKITAHCFSKSALEKITAAGGEAIVLPGKAPVVKNKMGAAKSAAK